MCTMLHNSAASGVLLFATLTPMSAVHVPNPTATYKILRQWAWCEQVIPLWTGGMLFRLLMIYITFLYCCV